MQCLEDTPTNPVERSSRCIALEWRGWWRRTVCAAASKAHKVFGNALRPCEPMQGAPCDLLGVLHGCYAQMNVRQGLTYGVVVPHRGWLNRPTMLPPHSLQMAGWLDKNVLEVCSVLSSVCNCEYTPQVYILHIPRSPITTPWQGEDLAEQ